MKVSLTAGTRYLGAATQLTTRGTLMTLPQIKHPSPVSVAADAAPAYWQRDALWSVLLSGRATLGQLTLIEQLMPKANGPPPLVHERMAEGF